MTAKGLASLGTEPLGTGLLGTGQAGTGPAGALAGLRVVDFGQYLAGPLAGMLLAGQGADVIHVDPPGGPRFGRPS